MNEKVSQQELINRIQQLEQEKVECGLADQESMRKCEAQYQAMLYDPDVVDASIDLFTKRGYQLH